MKKNINLFLVALIVLFMGVLNCYAKDGSSIPNAIDVNLNTNYKKIWNKDNSLKYHYNKIVLKERGILTFRTDKPISNGKYRNLFLAVLNSKGEEVWENFTYDYNKTLNYFQYSIALPAGTYYFREKLESAYLGDNFKPVNYKFSFVKNNNIELEPNNTFDKGTTIKKNVLYTAFIGDRGSKSDYFKFSGRKGVETRIYVGNYKNLKDLVSANFGIRNNNIKKNFYSSDVKYDKSKKCYYFTYTPTSNGMYSFFVNANVTEPVKYTIKINDVLIVKFKDYNGKVLKTSKVLTGGKAVAPKNPTRKGYTFVGWNKKYNNVTSNIIVTAKYKNKFKVVFKNYNGKVLKTTTVKYGKKAVAPKNPTRKGYKFIGWDKKYSNIKKDLVITAKFKIYTYTVTFRDYNNKVLKTQKVKYNKSAKAPKNPTRKGYKFVRWDKSFNKVTKNLTVKAVYKKA